METEEIVDVIYSYYPKNISLYHIDLYGNSIEYQKRLRKCQEAREDKVNWECFKGELNEFYIKEFQHALSDYSILGSEPCYCASINLGTEQEPIVISVLISVIVPLWTYRIVAGSDDLVRYQCEGKTEESIIILVRALILKYFPNYDIIEEDQHQVVIPDVDTVFQSGPTILEAIFKYDLN